MAKSFAYKAKDRSGQLLAGTLVADNEAAVAAYIRNKGYFVTQIKPAGESAAWRGLADLFRPVGAKDLAVFCRQFATMVDAGLSLVVSLGVLADQTASPRLKEAVKDILLKVQEGETLSRAMQAHPGVFPDMMVSMIEAGEVGGVLDVVLNRLAVHFEKEYKLNEKVKSALTYPAVVLTVAVLAVTFILVYVLPTFMQMFEQMKVELPPLTRALLATSAFLQQYGLAVAAAVAVLGYGLMLSVRRPQGRQALDGFMLHLPIFGSLWRKIAIARFSRTFSTLLRGGVPIITALEVVKRTTANQLMIKALTVAQASVRDGLGLSNPLGASGVFTPMVVQMAAVGEETGELDKMLEKVADFYESDVDDMVSRLSSLVEPVMIGMLAVIIGLIVISIIMPIFDAITSFGKIH